MAELSPQMNIRRLNESFRLSECEGISREDKCRLVCIIDRIAMFSVIWLKFSVYYWWVDAFMSKECHDSLLC